MTTYRRLKPKIRKAQILRAAMDLARTGGYHSLTLRGVARAAICSPGLVLNYFPSVEDLRTAVMTEAVRLEEIKIIAQGIVNSHIVALNAPQELRTKSLSLIAH